MLRLAAWFLDVRERKSLESCLGTPQTWAVGRGGGRKSWGIVLGKAAGRFWCTLPFQLFATF